MSQLPEDGFPQRRNPSPGVHIHIGRSNLVLLTVNALKRERWLANAEVQAMLHQTWSEARAWLVGDYLLMPDHVHCLCTPHDLRFTIESWIAYWKREFALRHKRPEWKFQSRGWHHRLRTGESYSDKWLYVQQNPVRQKLCAHLEDWPFKGRVFDLIWTDD